VHCACCARFISRGGIQMDVWIQLLTDVGFPIFVTFYLLHRIENQLARLIQAIYDLPEQLRIP